MYCHETIILIDENRILYVYGTRYAVRFIPRGDLQSTARSPERYVYSADRLGHSGGYKRGSAHHPETPSLPHAHISSWNTGTRKYGLWALYYTIL